MRTTITRWVVIAAATVTFCSWAGTQAQDVEWTGAASDWTSGASWNIDGVSYPDVQFDSRALINNGGIANVNGAVGQMSPTIVLGDGGGNSGTLNINGPSGSLMVASGGDGDPPSSGDVQVGNNGGTGILNIVSGGSLSVANQLSSATNADTASTVSLSGTASLSVGSAFLDRTLRISGSDVSFSSTGDVILGQAGTHTWEIPTTGASVLNISGQLDLGGTLRVELPGQTPSVGSSWDLADSQSVINGFGAIDDSAVAGLGAGVAFRVQSEAGGTNGPITRLRLEQRPIITINRQTGRVTMSNPGTTASVSMDVYELGSVLGAFNPANWTSLQDSSVENWQEANPSANALSELDPLGSSSLVGGTVHDLGTPFELPTPSELGEAVEDVTFRFGNETSGGYIDGEVRYTGTPNNNFVLNVDPATGETHLWNPTNFTVDVDVYQISSESGSLRFADGTWNSLDDQDADDGTWNEANPNSNVISELQSGGVTTFSQGTTFNLGTPFDVNGTRDLVFQFGLVNEDTLREGIVIYGAFSSVTGDFTGPDGVPDGVWDCFDINALSAEINAGTNDPAFDMNGDGQVTAADILVEGVGWLAVGGANNVPLTGGNPFLNGDADLNGDVDVSDFNTWNGSKFTDTFAWCSGDFNADGLVDVSDFNIWNGNKFTSSSDMAAVPEPASAILLLAMTVGMGLIRRPRAR